MPPPGVCLNIIEARQKQHGYGSFSKPDRFFNQDYEHLKHYCTINRLRYVDDMFPPHKNSIGKGILSPSDLDHVKWLRPAKISPNPGFVLDGVSRFDFGQGILGDCWLLASIGALTFQKPILTQVVPLEQTFDGDYCGLFHFRFWRFGRWVDVVIDDKLPTINGRLIFVHSKDQNEFWPPLLEKAYAKVCGSYTDMIAGTPAEAMMDFTGGVHMCIEMSDPPSNLWQLLCRAGQSTSLMGCGTPQGETPAKNVLPNGLVQGHAYTVTGVKQMMSQGQVVNLVRLWNPWGKGEWNGDWSDRSPLWKTVSADDRDLCLSVADDGEFWMTLQDICKYFRDLDICCLCPDFLDGSSSCHWNTSMYTGRWVPGTTAGGCMMHPDSFWTNPQYRVKIEGDYLEKDGGENVLISLMQKSDKRNRHLVQNLHIGLSVFEVTEEHKSCKGKFPATFFSSQAPVAQTKTYMNAREVMEFLRLKPAEYLIVPSTYKPNESSSFLLTIFSDTEAHGYENSGDHKHEAVEELTHVTNVQDDNKEEDFHKYSDELTVVQDDENKEKVFHKYSDKYEEVDAGQLQTLLNENILKGDLKSGGFSIDACRSMIALMDASITGKLNSQEFVHLWKKVVTYKDIFFHTDVSRTGTLSLTELRNAFAASGIKVKDEMLNLMAVRYGASSGHMTLENFVSLTLRLECMCTIFKQLSDGKAMTLQESEWMYVSMYT